jgi:hypothetical protein
MNAKIIVDKQTINTHKCIKAWSNVIDTSVKKYILVNYSFEDGYGNYLLYIYIRNISNGKVDQIIHIKKERKKIDFKKYLPNKIEVYVCIKGDKYEHFGPLWKTEPSKWFKSNVQHKVIRIDGFVNSLKILTVFNVFEFIESFITIEEGKFIFNIPVFSKSDFTKTEIENLNIIFNTLHIDTYFQKIINIPIIQFYEEFIKQWQKIVNN